MSQTTPRASHSTPQDNEGEYSEDEYSEDDEEYVDVDTWFTWFKTTEHYKELQKPVLEKPVLERSTNLMGNTGKQEPELVEIAPLC
jgi:hypothetical protein